MRINKFLVLGLILLLSVSLFCLFGCGGSGGGGTSSGGGGTPAAAGITGIVTGTDGMPVSAAICKLGLVGSEMASQVPDQTTDSLGRFTFSNLSTGVTYQLRVSKAGKYTMILDMLVSDSNANPNVSIPQPDGSGEINLTPPAAITLNAPVVGSNGSISLSWTQSQASNFSYYRIMRSQTSPVNSLSAQVGVFNVASTVSMTDGPLSQGTYYYRVYQVVTIENVGELSVGSNEVSCVVSGSAALPDYNALVILSNYTDDTGTANQGLCTLEPSSIAGTIASNLSVTLTTPFMTTSIPFGTNNWTTTNNYFFGNPITYVGQITDYFDSKPDIGAYFGEGPISGSITGKYTMNINGTDLEIADIPWSMPNNQMTDISLSKNPDNTLNIGWTLLENGTPVQGPGSTFDWRYLVRVYAGTGQTTNETGWCSSDTRNLSIRDFNGAISTIRNLPTQASNQATVPAGIFAPGTPINIRVVAFATASSYNSYSPTSAIPNHGRGYAYVVERHTDTTAP